ncbi:MAG: hypothetical protein ABJN42_07420 [Roseibium sp.]|uniref:hypothetical protein n=1 Tax=Roseibium sp. TaxID=1936156 RepID=UPI003297B009
MSEAEAIAAAIEEQRVHRGADTLRVTLGECATADGLRVEFARLNAKTAAYESFDPVEIEQSRVARHKRKFGEIFNMARVKRGATEAELRSALRDIAMATDMIFDADVEEDTLWMAKQRLKRQQPLPFEVTALDLDLS